MDYKVKDKVTIEGEGAHLIQNKGVNDVHLYYTDGYIILKSNEIVALELPIQAESPYGSTVGTIEAPAGSSIGEVSEQGQAILDAKTPEEVRSIIKAHEYNNRNSNGKYVTIELPYAANSYPDDRREYMVVGSRGTDEEIAIGHDGWQIQGEILTSRGGPAANNYHNHLWLNIGDNYRQRTIYSLRYPDDNRASDFSGLAHGKVNGELVYLIRRDASGGGNNNGAFFRGLISGNDSKLTNLFKIVQQKDIEDFVDITEYFRQFRIQTTGGVVPLPEPDVYKRSLIDAKTSVFEVKGPRVDVLVSLEDKIKLAVKSWPGTSKFSGTCEVNGSVISLDTHSYSSAESVIDLPIKNAVVTWNFASDGGLSWAQLKQFIHVEGSKVFVLTKYTSMGEGKF